MRRDELLEEIDGTEIAIVGMSGRFPGAKNIYEYWENLRDGIESITFYSDEELLEAGVRPEKLQNPAYVKAQGALDGIEEFDAGFFGVSPRDAAIMDPQHRHFLECSWEALEHAGYDPDQYEGAIGVFAGVGMNTYMMHNLLTNPGLLKSVGMFMVRHTSNDKDFLATRVSYAFNLKGPSINVQTACSTSLVSIHLAVQSLLNGESDMVLAGGSTFDMPQTRGYMFKEGEILSPDGHCRSFDADSKGTIFGSGLGVVVLKRMEDALKDGDTIHALLLSSAVNNDGSMKVGYMAPSVEGQAAVYAEALAVGEIDPESITYIEAHGTGTTVGDPIEVAALTEAFRTETDKRGFCGIGSVKSNIGHLDTAAGVASLIKVVQALKHKQIPPTLHFKNPNPALNIESSPFYVVDALQDWEVNGAPRRAGISSLGVGGTNAHVILEEAPEIESGAKGRSSSLFLISARTPEALDRNTKNLGDYLEKNASISELDAAYTLAVGRRTFKHRRALVCENREDAYKALQELDSTAYTTQAATNEQQKSVVYLFPGAGAQYVNMAEGLYKEEPVFKDVVDECARILAKAENLDLIAALFPTDSQLEQAKKAIERPYVAHPTLFVIEYALAKLWMSWGIEPAAMIGHSRGEYVAACLAEVISLEDALRLVCLRGRLIEQTEPGGMLSIPLPARDVEKMLNDDLTFASINAPSHCVVSGAEAAIEALEKELQGASIDYRRLNIQVGYHSKLMEPVLGEFRDFVKSLRLHEPQRPFISNVTGTWITPQEATDPEYWVSHLRNTVAFSKGMDVLLENDQFVYLEIGPGRTLTTFLRMHDSVPAAQRNGFNSIRHPKDVQPDLPFLLNTLGRLWMAGVSVNWEAFYGTETRQRVPLPTYSFDHQSYWIEPGVSRSLEEETDYSLKKRDDLSEWFYQPGWKALPLLADSGLSESERDPEEEEDRQNYVFFSSGSSLESDLIKTIQEAGHRVQTAYIGETFTHIDEQSFEIAPGNEEDLTRLMKSLHEAEFEVNHIVFGWSLLGEDVGEDKYLESYDLIQSRGFYSLFLIAQSLGEKSVHIDVLTNGIHSVAGERIVSPLASTVLGPVRVIPREFPEVSCRNIDVNQLSGTASRWLHQQVSREVLFGEQDGVIAYRGFRRWAPHVESILVHERNEQAPVCFKSKGVYLLTGGLGGLAHVIGEYLAKHFQARLVLLSRSEFPERAAWDSWEDSHGPNDSVGKRIKNVMQLEALGAEVLVLQADVTDVSQMEQVVSKSREAFGSINGVIHAAGVLNDTLISLKSADDAAGVMDPKVKGALVLDHVLRGEEMDCWIFYSSVSSILGIMGQVDYTAANAFLDSFAQYIAQRDNVYSVAINWNAWRDVGMAASLIANNARSIPANGQGVAHPFIDSKLEESNGDSLFWVTLNAEHHWMIDEHRMTETEAVIPGTGYLELVYAAFVNGTAGPVEISDVYFMEPFVVEDGNEKTLFLKFSDDGDRRSFTMTSRVEKGADHEHVMGRIKSAASPGGEVNDLEELRASIGGSGAKETSTAEINSHLLFGPRWDNLRTIHFGEQIGMAELSLDEKYLDDLNRINIHPSLLDIGITFGQGLVPGFNPEVEFYVPLSISRLTVYESLDAHFYSYVRCHNEDPSEREVAIFDVQLMNREGRVLVELEQFVMRRVQVEDLKRAVDIPDSARDQGAEDDAELDLLTSSLTEGIGPEEGKEVLHRALSDGLMPQLIISSQDFFALQAVVDEQSNEGGDALSDQGSGLQLSPRPSLSSTYVAPRSELEQKMALIWQELLGVDEIGVHDDFFELGGHSLLAIKLFGRLESATGKRLLAATIFQSSTIEKLAIVVEGGEGGGDPDDAPEPLEDSIRRLGILAESSLEQVLNWVREEMGGGDGASHEISSTDEAVTVEEAYKKLGI